jgi:hypothetical protein
MEPKKIKKDKVFNIEKSSVENNNYPVGLIFILIYIGFGIFGSIISLKNPAIQLGPSIYYGTVALIYFLLTLIIFIVLFYGILKRKKWALKLSIIYFILIILMSLINIMFFLINPNIYSDYLSKISPELKITDETRPYFYIGFFATLIPTIIIVIAILVYLFIKKGYFKN